MLIRLAAIDDAEVISKLICPLAEKFIAGDLSPEGARNLLSSLTPAAIAEYFRSGYRYHVAVESGEVVGAVAVRNNQHLYHLFVAERYQRRGIARDLWHVARQASDDAGGSGSFTVHSSRFAVQAYRRLGFVDVSGPVEEDGVVFVPMRTLEVVPWGRSFDEYVRMFGLARRDLQKSILGCADGPAAFNADLTARGGKVISCDPLYALSAGEIEARIHSCFETVLDQARLHADRYVWSEAIPDVTSLGRVRMQSMQRFLDDFPAGASQGRYVDAQLPTLPCGDGQFDIALCSHFLFLYESLGLEFHVRSIREMMRVAEDVRVFPLMQLDGTRSLLVPRVIELLGSSRLAARVVTVDYEFQEGANKMLQVSRAS